MIFIYFYLHIHDMICKFYRYINILEGSLEVKLLTICTDERQRWEESEKRKRQKKEDAGARTGRKVAILCVFQWFVAPEGQKVGSLKRRVQSHLSRWEMRNCTPLWREAHVEVNTLKAPHFRASFGRSDVVLCGRRKGFCTLPKVSNTCGFFRGFRHVHRRPERDCAFEHQIFRFAKMILRDRWSTSYELASLFRGRRNTLVENRKTHWHEAVSSALKFPSWRKPPRIASFFMLSTSNNEEFSQNCFVLTVSSWNIEEISPSCCVFDVVKLKHWGHLGKLQRCRRCQV